MLGWRLLQVSSNCNALNGSMHLFFFILKSITIKLSYIRFWKVKNFRFKYAYLYIKYFRSYYSSWTYYKTFYASYPKYIIPKGIYKKYSVKISLPKFLFNFSPIKKDSWFPFFFMRMILCFLYVSNYYYCLISD